MNNINDVAFYILLFIAAFIVAFIGGYIGVTIARLIGDYRKRKKKKENIR